MLLDQNVGTQVVDILSARGIHATRLSDLGLRAAPDAQVLETANDRGEVLFTFDLDFGLLTKPTNACSTGVVLIKPGNLTDEQLTHCIDVLLESEFVVRVPFLIVATVKGPLVALRSRQLT